MGCFGPWAMGIPEVSSLLKIFKDLSVPLGSTVCHCHGLPFEGLGLGPNEPGKALSAGQESLLQMRRGHGRAQLSIEFVINHES